MSSGSSRPLGVTIIASLVLLGAVFGLCGGLTHLGIAPLNALRLDIFGIFTDAFDAVITIVLSLASLAVAFGLFNLAGWAFWVTVVVEGFHVLNGLAHGRGVIGLIIPIAILAYLLLDRNVRNAFRT